ncbi:transporter substrate-binding domain-containing protein [Undibacter mobilis]|uniref:ABC transporter substrate-binding protein n=1 Tax=Undibacter mobilis TaxID=2292256 RepID=A0A371BD71_9BRAD|nr:transporter substrate-binding domain-containing protein [Undibacter mobilis]RDV05498.1 ABC transporter substrate-binding protein [Undibacter mobilis]
MIDTQHLQSLAPAGTLRGGVVVAPAKSISFATTGDDGAVQGVPVDLLRGFAALLNVPLALTEFPNSGQLTDAIAEGRCDIGFMPRDAAREARVAFGPSFYLMGSTYLVPAGSEIFTIEAVNREGIRIVAIANTTTARAARRTAPLAMVEEVPSVELMTAMAQRGEADAFALSHDSFAGLLPRIPGARILPGQFQQTGIGVAVPPGRPGALVLARALIEEAKTNGLVRRAFDAAGFVDAAVAPLES